VDEMEEEILKKMFSKEELIQLEKDCEKFVKDCEQGDVQKNLQNMLIKAAINQTIIMPAILERLVVALEYNLDLKLSTQQPTQKRVEFLYPQTLFDRKSKEDEDHHRLGLDLFQE